MMNNKEFYKRTFDQIHVSEELLGKVKMQKNKKLLVRRNYYAKCAAAAILVFIIIGSNVICYAATGKSLYAFVINSSIIQDYFYQGGEAQVADQIKNDTEYGQNQSVAYGNYLFTLYRYYAEKSSGNILAEFCITNSEGNQLSDEEFKNLETSSGVGLDEKIEFFEISLKEGFNGGTQCKFYRDEDGNAIFALHCLVALLGPEDRKVNTRNIEQFSGFVLSSIDVDGKVSEIGTFKIPSKPTQLESITFNLNENPKIEYAVMSGIGMQIVFNTNVARDELEKELEASGIKDDPSYDPEEHGYTLYNDISVYMKDGTKYRIFPDCEEYEAEDALVPLGLVSNNPYEYSTGLSDVIFGFGKMLDVSQVTYIEIDGEQYQVQD